MDEIKKIPPTEKKLDKPQFASEFVSQHDEEIAQSREYYVVQHNDMVQKQRFTVGKNAGNSLTVTEEKVLAYLISKIKPGADSLEPIEMDIKTFCEVCGRKNWPAVSCGFMMTQQRAKQQSDILNGSPCTSEADGSGLFSIRFSNRT